MKEDLVLEIGILLDIFVYTSKKTDLKFRPAFRNGIQKQLTR